MRPHNLCPILLGLILTLGCKEQTSPMVSYDDFDSLSYNIYFGDRIAGYQNSWKDDGGDYRFEFEFNDRGRGPYYDEIIRLNDQGTIEYQQILGHNYLKDTVAETFEVTGTRASWTSSSESGFAEFGGNAYFTSINGSFGSNELLIRELLKRGAKEIDLLPSGNVKMVSVDDHTFGDTLNLKLITLTGFSFTPSYLWMDDDNRFFASTSNWFSCIQVGYDSLRNDLFEIQENAENQYFLDLAASLTKQPEKDVAFSNVNVYNPDLRIIEDDQTVIVRGSDIIEAGPSSEVQVEDEAEIIDGKGMTMMPGLFDMHVHIGKTDGLLHLAAGVTSVRDLANALDLPDLRKKFESNALIGPRIVTMCGFIDQAGPYAGPTGKIVETLEEGLEAIDFYKERGYEQIKLYSSIDPGWVKSLTKKAHDVDMKISGHIPAYMTASQAVEDGYDEIQHVNMLILNFLSDTIDTRTPLRFSMVADYGHAINTDGTEFKSFIQLLKRKNTIVDPTVSIFEGMFRTKAGEPDPSFAMILDRLPVQVKRGFYSGGLPIPDGKEQRYYDSFDKMLEFVRKLHENEIPIVPGTDAMAGFGLHRELENYVKAGIPEKDVLYYATLGSAKVVGREKDLGSIATGKKADFILVDGDPLSDINDIRRVVLTVKDGNIYDPKELYSAIGVKHFE